MADQPLNSIKFPGLPNRYMIPKVSDVYSETSSDAMSGKAVKAAIDAIPKGVTPDLKLALLQIAQKVAYIDEDGSDYYQDLYDALYPDSVTVTNNLTGCISNNSATRVNVGDSYTAVIVANTGYMMAGASVSITMNGVNITASAYNNGTISIASVTGNLIITISAVAVTLSSISAVFNQGRNVVYDTDSLDSLKPMLVVTAIYSDSSTATVPATDYTLSGTLTAGTSTITVTYQSKTDTFTVVVTQVAPGSLTVTNNLTGCTNSNAATSLSEGDSYTATITASTGYTMTGATVSVTMGGTDITSTAYSNGTISIASVTGNLVITISAVAVTLSSIDAVFTQGQTVVYDTDTLDSLKSMLVVTAIYSDSSTATVPSTDYTLSGTLTAGTSTITVSYGGKTDTFNVTVTAAPVSTVLYDWDFKTSLTDSVSGVVATTTATRDSNGLTFTELGTYLDLGAVYSRDRTYEIDISYIGEPNSGSSAYRRIFAFGTNGTQTASGTAALIVPMSTYRRGWYFYLGSSWDSAAISTSLSSETQYNYFDGKTMKIYLDSNGYAHVYEKPIGADDSAYTLAGESHGALNAFNNTAHVYIGGSDADRIAYARVTGFRIYEGEK